MALAQEAIEPDEKVQPAPREGFSARPVMLAALGSAVLLGLAVWVVAEDDKPTRLEHDGDKPQLLVPDRRAADELARSAAQKNAAGAGTAATTQNANPFGQPKEAPPGNLGVTAGPVPDLPSDSYGATPGAGGDVGLGLGGGPSFGSVAAQQLEAHALDVQKWQLDLRKAAFSGSSSAPAFAELKKQESEANALSRGREGGADDPASAMMAAVGPSLSMLGAGGGGSGGWARPGAPESQTVPGTDPHMNREKLAFFQRGGEQLEPARLEASVRAPTSPFELQMGSVIPGVLISGIHSESPGQIIGQVSEHVYDSAAGRHLLIPQGSRLVGTYSAMIAQGQSRVQIAWVRLNFPDGSTLDLGGMPGADQAGTAGFEDKINRHFARRLAAALMTSSLTVAYEATAPSNARGMEGAVHRGVGESLVQLGADMAKEEGQLPPTLEIRAGYRFLIHVTRDIGFPGPYEDGIERRFVRR